MGPSDFNPFGTMYVPPGYMFVPASTNVEPPKEANPARERSFERLCNFYEKIDRPRFAREVYNVQNSTWEKTYKALSNRQCSKR